MKRPIPTTQNLEGLNDQLGRAWQRIRSYADRYELHDRVGPTGALEHAAELVALARAQVEDAIDYSEGRLV